MNRLGIKLVNLLALLLLNSAIATADQRVIWDKTPIPVQLVIGQERLIHFPSDIRYWLPDHLAQKVSVLSANGVLYLHAKQPFIKTRLRVQALESQQLYLLDIASQPANDNQDNTEALIITDKAVVPNHSNQRKKQEPPTDWSVRLTRFAAQMLYAPERLAPADQQIRRVNINTAATVPLLRHHSIEAKPLGAWRGGGLTVTAVLIRNNSQKTISLALQKNAANPIDVSENTIYLSTAIRGDWLTVTPQHTLLTAAGSDEDRTCLYLVSRQQFFEALSASSKVRERGRE